MEKNKIQIGTIIHLEKGKRPSDLKETFSEPIYADWTPELQKSKDDLLKRFAEYLAHDLIEYTKTGGDMNNLTTKKVYSHLKNIYKK